MEEIRPGRYRHFKGKEYRVLYTARHSETLEPMVVYQALYGERGIWVRPAAMWGGARGAGGLFRPPLRLSGRGGVNREHPDLWQKQVL